MHRIWNQFSMKGCYICGRIKVYIYVYYTFAVSDKEYQYMIHRCTVFDTVLQYMFHNFS